MKRNILVIFSATLLLFTLFFADQSSPHAGASETIYTVTKTTDTDDGVCDTDCSLREAVAAANANSGMDTVYIDPPSGDIVLTLGELVVSEGALIRAPGCCQNINGNATSRIFNIQSGAEVTIQYLIIENGSSTQGGGILNAGDLTIKNTLVGGNSATGAFGDGGGIYNLGTLTISDNAAVSSNTAAFGGGIYNQGGTVLVDGASINGNTATSGSGGGIRNWQNGLVTVRDSQIRDNHADDTGGGIRNIDTSRLFVENTWFENNTSFDGGGLHNEGEAYVHSSLLEGNDASTVWGTGGGIFNGGTLTVINSTFSANRAANGGGIGNVSWASLVNDTLYENEGFGLGGGLYNHTDGTVIATNVLIGNSVNNDDCANLGTLVTKVPNMDSDNTCDGFLTNANLMVSPLQSAGGPTQTHPLQLGSPAIDAGTGLGNCPATDQRGYFRPIDGDSDSTPTCDIGAYEFGSSPASLIYLPVVKK